MVQRQERAFITGGAGFIGSHLVDTFLNRGLSVTVYDKLSKGTLERIERHVGREGFRFVQGDLLDRALLEESIADHDIVWHLAANSDIPGGNKNPELDVRDGILATHSLLETIRRTGPKKLIFSSSSTIYGETEILPTPEDAGPLLPISAYGAAKLACEGLISAYCHLFNLQAWIFRFGNVEGHRMDHGVIFDFIHKLRSNPQELEILGDGEQEKNYFLVEDCIEGMLFASRHAKDKPCDVFNLGCDTTIKVTDIAHTVVKEMVLKDVRFRYTGGKRGWPGDVPKVIYDVSKVKKLGWEAKHTSAEVVSITTRRLLGKE